MPTVESVTLVHPVVVGQGKPAFPSDARAQLELLEEHRFGNGVVYLRYRTAAPFLGWGSGHE